MTGPMFAGEHQRDRSGRPEICNRRHPPRPRPLPRHHQVNWGRETFLQDSAFPRYNVDPFDAHTDEEVWRAIERANLKKKVLEIIIFFFNILRLSELETLKFWRPITLLNTFVTRS